MAFWNNSPTAEVPATIAQAQAQLEQSQLALAQARRRLLGGAILLVLACALIPWLLDSSPRPWGEDVILRMPKSDQPYQTKPTVATPAAAPAAAPVAAAAAPTAVPAPVVKPTAQAKP
jgi:hypothetical protein